MGGRPDKIERAVPLVRPHIQRQKSGARYRLNRWREQEISAGNQITYGDLVREYARLCGVSGRFPQARSGRYINFLSDFLRREKGISRKHAIAAWHELKKLDVPKTYSAWRKWQRRTDAE